MKEKVLSILCALLMSLGAQAQDAELFVHTVEYDYLWAELNLFSNDIPLDIKDYKGIRLELAVVPEDNNFHIKVYGDGSQKEDYLSLTGASTTIIFNTDIFSNEINRVTLQACIDGKSEIKVICACLIRHDGTEEYSDISPFHGCEITNVEKYEQPVTIRANDLTMFCGDEVPELTYTTEGGMLIGTPTLTTTATSASPVGIYPIKVERGTVTNSNVNFIDGTLSIKKRPIHPEGEFETAVEAVKNMKIGWNLWNTLESHGGLNSIYNPANYQSLETEWGHPKTKPELMKMLRKAGFNAIRVPVTWFPYMDEDGNVDSRWMKRVHEVVDYVIDQGMYCLLNVHHDTGDGDFCWIKADETNYNKNHKRFENLWRQIADEFKDYDEHLLFEGYNEMVDLWNSWWPHPYSFSEWSETKPGVWEPTGHDEAIERSIYNAVNNYAQSFVDAVRSTGGNNLTRNLVVNTYAASCGASSESGKDYPLANLKIPDDEAQDHIAIQIHYYPDLSIKGEAEKETEQYLSKWNEHIKALHAPLIIGEWDMKEGTEEGLSYSKYLLKNTAPYDIATFVFGATPSYNDRSLPAFKYPEHVRAMLKGYYGEGYEPTLLTEDDYGFHVKVSYDCIYAELKMYDEGELHQYLDLNEYKGIRIQLENIDGIAVKAYGETDGKEQYFAMSSPEETFSFDKSELGNNIRSITLQNWKEGKNETKILHAYLIKKDGTEESIDINQYGVYHNCEFEIIMERKQFVHTVEYDGPWSELNLFYDDIPLKLKNYKGIRLELAGKSDDVNIKVYGDGEEKEEYLPLTGVSTSILFNTDIFSDEINRVTLQFNKDDKGEVKVISAWLIRQDGTEEYSDLSPFHGCEITQVEDYLPSINGDANGDGTVDAKDIVDIVSHTMGKPTSTGSFNEKAADMNGDGVVNIADIIQIANIIMGK